MPSESRGFKNMQNFLLTHCFNICMKKDFSKKKECVRIQGGWKGGRGARFLPVSGKIKTSVVPTKEKSRVESVVLVGVLQRHAHLV